MLTSDQPRERLSRLGAAALSTRELLALLINSGTRSRSAYQIASDLLSTYSSLTDMAGRDVAELRKHVGMGTAKAATLSAAFELAHRIQSEPFRRELSVTSPETIAKFFAPRLRHLRKETFIVVLLNTANQVVRDAVVCEGSLNAVVIHPREVFRLAIAESAAAIILIHNHPSGNTEPSREDIAITKRLAEAGRILDIRVLDHVIIGGDAYSSFSERNLL